MSWVTLGLVIGAVASVTAVVVGSAAFVFGVVCGAAAGCQRTSQQTVSRLSDAIARRIEQGAAERLKGALSRHPASKAN